MRVRTIEVRVSGEPAVALAALEPVARAIVASGALEELRVIEVDEHTLVLHLLGADEEATERAWREAIEPELESAGLVLRASQEGAVALRVRRATEADALVGLDDDARRERFVGEVAGSGTIWGLYGETWARSSAAGEVEALPFWSGAADAARCIEGPWAGFVPRSIELEAFVEQWLAGMEEDGIVAVLLPTPLEPGAIVGPAELAAALREAAT